MYRQLSGDLESAYEDLPDGLCAESNNLMVSEAQESNHAKGDNSTLT